MGLIFSAAEVADLRRRILVTLNHEDLVALNQSLYEAMSSVTEVAEDARSTAQEAKTGATIATAAVTGAASVGYVNSLLANRITRNQLTETIHNLSSEEYMDGKIDGSYSGHVTISGTKLTFSNGILVGVTP